MGGRDALGGQWRDGCRLVMVEFHCVLPHHQLGDWWGPWGLVYEWCGWCSGLGRLGKVGGRK